MKNILKNTVVGGISSLSLLSSSMLAEEVKEGDAPAKVCDKADKADIALELMKEALQKAELSTEKSKEVLAEMRKHLSESEVNLKVISETVIIGPDGKVVTGGKGGLDSDKLKELLSDLENGDIKELLEGNQDAIVSGKVVIIDQDGNRVEKELGEGKTLSLALKKAFENLPFDLQPEKKDAKKPAEKGDTSAQLKELTKKVSELQALLEELADKQK